MAVTKDALFLDFKSAGNSASTGAVATGVAIPVDKYIVVTTQGSGTSGVTSGVSDSKGHTWSSDTKLFNATTGGGWTQTFYTKVTSAFLTTDTITVTRTGTGSLLAQARVLNGVDLTTPTVGTPVTGTNGANSTAITTSGAITVGAGDLIMASVEMAAAGTGLSAVASGFTKESDGVSTTTNTRAYGTFYQVAPSGTSYTPAATATATCLWAVHAIAFKAAATSANATVNAVAATATSTAPAPVASAGSSVAAVRGTVTSQAVAPTATATASVTAVKGTVTSLAPAPTVALGTQVAAATATATSQAGTSPPLVSAGSSVTAVRGQSTAGAATPAVSASSGATAPALGVSTTAPAPAIHASATVAAVTATVTASAAAPQASQVQDATVHAVPATVAIGTVAPLVPQSLYFTPPTTFEACDDPFWGRYRGVLVGISVVQVDGHFVQQPYPWLGDIATLHEGVTWFQGGRTYEVTEATAAALEADGFETTQPTPVPVEPTGELGFGEGGFGEGPFGG